MTTTKQQLTEQTGHAQKHRRQRPHAPLTRAGVPRGVQYSQEARPTPPELVEFPAVEHSPQIADPKRVMCGAPSMTQHMGGNPLNTPAPVPDFLAAPIRMYTDEQVYPPGSHQAALHHPGTVHEIRVANIQESDVTPDGAIAYQRMAEGTTQAEIAEREALEVEGWSY